MADGFFDSIASVLPTIGKVVGSLLGGTFGEEQNNYVGFFADSNQNGDLDKAVFTMDDNRIYLCNTSPKKDDHIVFSTPTQLGSQADTLVIPGLKRADVTPIFSNSSNGGSDRFAINACKKISSNDGNTITIYAANDDVIINGLSSAVDAKWKLGNFFEFEMSDSHTCAITLTAIAAAAYVFRKVDHIHISAGNMAFDFVNPPQREIQQGIQVNFPQAIPANVHVAIDIQAEIFERLPFDDERVESMNDEQLQKLIRIKMQRNKMNLK